jgi:hypothetical protein
MARGHSLGPFRLGGPPLGLEVLEVSNVMHFDLLSGPALFTGVGQEPLHELRPSLAAVTDDLQYGFGALHSHTSPSLLIS